MDYTIYYISIPIIIAVAVAGWIIVHRKPPTPPTLLPEGWQLYDFPTNGEPPGTIFRITKDKHRYIVNDPGDLKGVALAHCQEAMGTTSYKTLASMGSSVKLLGLDIKVDVSAQQNQELKFEIENPTIKEWVTDGIRPALKKAFEKYGFIIDNRYFVIREARSTMKIDYELSKNLVDSLGGEANIKGKIGATATALERKNDLTYVLKREFSEPMRIMFNPEEIKKQEEEITFGGAPVKQPPKFTLEPVKERIEWTETVNAPRKPPEKPSLGV